MVTYCLIYSEPWYDEGRGQGLHSHRASCHPDVQRLQQLCHLVCLWPGCAFVIILSLHELGSQRAGRGREPRGPPAASRGRRGAGCPEQSFLPDTAPSGLCAHCLHVPLPFCTILLNRKNFF